MIRVSSLLPPCPISLRLNDLLRVGFFLIRPLYCRDLLIFWIGLGNNIFHFKLCDFGFMQPLQMTRVLNSN